MKKENPMFTIINADIAVGPVPTLSLQRVLKTLGFASVVSAASDADFAEAGRTAGEVALAVEAANMIYRDLPEDHDAAAMRLHELIDALPKPIYLFAADEADAAGLWAAAMTGVLEESAIRHALARVGRLPVETEMSELAA